MAIFDELRCFYPLPVPGANALIFQTKDTPLQALGKYVIRADGQLWRDASEFAWPSGVAALEQRSIVLVRRHWAPEPYTGHLVFYTTLSGDSPVAFEAVLLAGQVTGLRVVPDDASRAPISPKASDENRKRVDRSQSAAAFLDAARDYQRIVDAGRQHACTHTRLVAQVAAVLRAGATQGEEGLTELCFGPASSIARRLQRAANVPSDLAGWVREALVAW